MDRKFNGTTVETDGVRSIAGGGTGATTAEQAKINLGITGGVTSYNDLTDLPTLGTAAATAATDYATAAQGAKADSAIQPSPLDFAPVQTIRVLTQTEYDALSPKDQNTLYFIK